MSNFKQHPTERIFGIETNRFCFERKKNKDREQAYVFCHMFHVYKFINTQDLCIYVPDISNYFCVEKVACL